jgi:hypothetical protein
VLTVSFFFFSSSQARTSSTAWLYDTPIQEVIHQRVSELVGCPPSHVEANALTRYWVGEQYQPHYDSQKNSVPYRRISMSVALSLELDEEIPDASIKFPLLNLTLPHRAGQAYLWRNYKPNDEEHDPLLLHGFSAPRRGELYTLTIFVFPHAIRPEPTAVPGALPAAPPKYIDYRLGKNQEKAKVENAAKQEDSAMNEQQPRETSY